MKSHKPLAMLPNRSSLGGSCEDPTRRIVRRSPKIHVSFLIFHQKFCERHLSRRRSRLNRSPCVETKEREINLAKTECGIDWNAEQRSELVTRNRGAAWTKVSVVCERGRDGAMLLRGGPSELGRHLLHEWRALRAAAGVVSTSSSNRTRESRPEEVPRLFDDDAGQLRQAASGRSPKFLTDWTIFRDFSVQFRSQHALTLQQHLKLGLREVLQQQRCGIVTSAHCNAEEGTGEEEPVRSPLSQAPGPLQGSGGQKLGVSPTRTAQAVLTGIRQSPQKLNLVAEMVRGMRVEDALTQMAVSVKRAAKTVFKVVHSAQANAVHNFGLEKDRLIVSEAFVGKDRYLKRMMPHGKGKAGKMEHARARLTVIVKEMSPEQETDLARLRVLRSRNSRMTRAEARLVPHRVLATQWSRQRPTAVAAAAASEGGEPAAAQ